MSCRDIAPLLSERAAGALAPAEAARLAGHLAGCEACRAEAARLDDLLSLLRVPEASPAEERAAAFLPARTTAAARAGVPARSRLGWASAGAAAALAVSLGVGAGLRTRPAPEGEVVAAATSAAAAWQEPDPDELWEWSGEVGLDSEESP